MSSDDLRALQTAIETQTEALQAHTAALQSHHQIAEQWGPLMAHPAADPVLTRNQAAQYCGRHPKTLERAAKAGDLPYLQTGDGGRIQYRLSALNAWLDTLSSTPTKPRRADKERQWGI
jgi:hypothetical protein